MTKSRFKRILAMMSVMMITTGMTGEHVLAVSDNPMVLGDEAIDSEVSSGNTDTEDEMADADTKSEKSDDSNVTHSENTIEDSDLDPINPNENSDEDNKSEENEAFVPDNENTEIEEPAITDGDAAENEDEEPSDDKEKLASKAFLYETEVNGYHFVFSADENVVPDGTIAEVKVIENDKELIDKIESSEGRTVLDSVSFDIRLYADGSEIQPEDGMVHIALQLSDEAMISQEENAGASELKVIHVHDGDANELESEESREDSDIEIPSDIDEEALVTEDMIDPETMTMKEGVSVPVMVNAGVSDKEYYQSTTLDFDTESFSEFVVVNLSNYPYEANMTVSGNETVIDLSNMRDDLVADFYGVVQGALGKAWGKTKTDLSKYYRIIIPAGTYYLKRNEVDDPSPLKVGNNTTIQMDGVTIINQQDDLMLTTRKPEGTRKGKFDDYHNIVISGGCWDANGFSTTHSMIKLAHMTGLELRNVTITGGASPHMLEIAACKDVKVTGCTFKDTRHGGNELEAFQIDVQQEGMMTYVQDPANDDYPCKNVEVSNCTFSNLYRGFGSHGAIAGPFYYSNINVQNCRFDNIINTAIMCTMWKNSQISGNVLTNVGRGIDTTTYPWYTRYPTEVDDKPKSLSYTANLIISGNSISLGGADRDSGTWAGILLSGYYSATETDDYPSGLYPVSGFTVSGNTISGYKDWGSYKQDDVYADIYTLYAKGANISNNTLTDSCYGILVKGSGEVSSLNSNHFGAEKYANIAVKNGGAVQDMSSNVLTMDCPFGLYVDDESSCNGTSEVAAYNMGVGETVSTRTSKFSLFTYDLIDKTAGTYKSNKKAVAKATKAGKVKGIKKGKTQITASWERGGGTVYLNFTANVKKAPTKIKVPKKKTVRKGTTYQLKPKTNKGAFCNKYKYKSSNKKVAKVSSTGVVTGRKKGVATITVTSYNGVSTTIQIKVK
ncbi:Ig-like domain-containing protein [Butyrivibrio sp. JL13D10]|uniref:Ig-like domain-containing protein n=1 Tax=Butyrivibrio sp. JL13D10 TaxID=3236815 RepID=UPI0038B463D0